MILSLTAIAILAAASAAAPAGGNPNEVVRLERAVADEPGSSSALLNLGWGYLRGGRTDEAARIGSKLLKLDPENRTFLNFQANADIERRRYGKAADLAERSLRIAPGDHDASLILAQALFLGGRHSEGLAALEKVVKAFPDDRGAIFRKSQFLAVMGRNREAMAAVDELLAADSENADYRRSRAALLSAMGRGAEAKQEWIRLGRAEGDQKSLMNLGWAYWRENNLDAAYKTASTLVKLDGANPEYLRFMANLSIERTSFSEGLRLAQKAHSLEPANLNVNLTLARALYHLARDREALAILRKLGARYRKNSVVQYRLGELLIQTGRFEEAIGVFKRLVRHHPENAVYRLDLGKCLYGAKRYAEGVAQWTVLAQREPPNRAALHLLRNDAFNRREWWSATQWQSKILELDPSDAAAWETLSVINRNQRLWPSALWSIDRAIAADPKSVSALYNKAEILAQMRLHSASEAVFAELLARNPNSVRARVGLSEAVEAQGRFKDAREILEHLDDLAVPVNSAFLQVRKARLLADENRGADALELLAASVSKDDTPIPVLLYHGISLIDRDIAMPQESFRLQMAALKREGYTSMTVSELKRVYDGLDPLPAKPILITFDDGRIDSFENASPVLQEAGFKATMFVHVTELRKPYFHASPEDMRRWQESGSWELQAHGYRAHDPIVLSPDGRRGRFLANRIWIADSRRFETLDELRSRLDLDYRVARAGIERIVPGHPPVAFAYPYSDYGQGDFTNTPEAASLNLATVRAYFPMVFTQERYGVNTLHTDPMEMKRFEVPRHMSAEELIAHLKSSDPYVQARKVEAAIWLSADQAGRADAVYRSLRERGVPESTLLAQRGSVRSRFGDVGSARGLFALAAAEDDGRDDAAGERARTSLARAEYAAAPSLDAEFRRFTDSDANEASKALLRASWSMKSLRAGIFAGGGRYSDRRHPSMNLPAVESREAGLQMRWFALDSLEFDGSYLRREYRKGATGFTDAYAVSASYQALAWLRGTIRNGAGDVETAEAIRLGRKFRSYGAGLEWNPALYWTANADYDRIRYNDGNREDGIRARLTRRLSDWLSLGAVYSHRDSNRLAADYYTPRGLDQYGGIVSLNRDFGAVNLRTGRSLASVRVQYRGGYGVEPAGSRAVHSVRNVITLRPFTHLSLNADAQYSQSPTYIGRSAVGTLSLIF